MNPLSKIHGSWKPFLTDLIKNNPELVNLNTQILPNINYYPQREDVFNVFSMPVEDIKVVILGQDPYHTKNQALGYSFAVPEDKPIPPSLRIMAKELGKTDYTTDLKWRTLQHWREQGVFLLNTALTVEENKAGSHLSYWERFTQSVIRFISFTQPCIWLLWGKKARSYEDFIAGEVKEKGMYNTILEAPHPASETYKPGSGFIGCNHFVIVNKLLQLQGKEIINW